MKSLITYALLAAYVLWTLVSCGPVDPATGIILDAPAHWRGSPDPLDTPETFHHASPSHGDFGPGWLYR